MRYYFLGYDTDDHRKNYTIIGTCYNSKNEVIGQFLNEGKPLVASEVNNPFTIIPNQSTQNPKKKLLNDKISCSVQEPGYILLVSNSFADFAEQEFPGAIEFYEAEIRSAFFTRSDYKIGNIPIKIDCVDFEKSDLSTYGDGDIRGIEELVLDRARIPDNIDIFLLGRRAGAIIIVSERFRKAVQRKGFTGFFFVNLNEAYELY